MSAVPKVVFDTNVLVSATLSPRGASLELLYLAAEGKITAYTSNAIIEEFKEIIRRDFEVPFKKAEEMAGVYLQFLKLVEPNRTINAIIADEDDNRILECGAYTKADYIASWDPHLTDLKEFEGITILNPGKLLSILKEVYKL